jgi:hypothetical protein
MPAAVGDSKFYLVNPESGAGNFLRTMGGSEPVNGIAFEP